MNKPKNKMEQQNTTAVVAVDPSEFGLQESQVKNVMSSFLPKITERDGLVSVYENLLTQEITKDTCSQAGDLRKKLVKIRTGIAEVHKSEKAYHLAAGRYVDAIKNKVTLPVEQMEEKLLEVEKHFENLERQEKEKLQQLRVNELQQYFPDAHLVGLSDMDEDVYRAYFTAKKTAHDERLEAERLAEVARQEELAKDTERLKQQEIENARLRKEKEVRELRASQMQPYIVFIRDYNAMISLPENEFKKELQDVQKSAADQWEADRIAKENRDAEMESMRKKTREAEAKLEAERKAMADKIAKEQEANRLMVKQQEKERLEKLNREQEELKKGDAEKVEDLKKYLLDTAGKFEFKSSKNKNMFQDVQKLIGKVVAHIDTFV